MVRTFNIADARLLEHAGVILEALGIDLPVFSTFDPDLNEERVAQLRALWVTSLEEGGDDVARGKLGVKTQNLLDEMKRCNKMIASLRYWVKKAFENDPAKQRRFQLTRYWKVQAQQPQLITYMASLATVVAELRPELEAANAPAGLLDSVKQIADALSAANVVQENSKGGRGSSTQERIIRLNTIYKECRILSDAAEFVFGDDPARRELYRIPGNSQPSTADEEDDMFEEGDSIAAE